MLHELLDLLEWSIPDHEAIVEVSGVDDDVVLDVCIGYGGGFPFNEVSVGHGASGTASHGDTSDLLVSGFVVGEEVVV